MPLRLLRAAGERLQLGKQLRDDAEIQREREADRRPRREQQLLELAPDALGRQIVERDRRGRAPRVASSSVKLEARGELHARAARAGCRRRTSADRRRAAAAASRSPRPSNGSRYSPVSGSHEIALTVKSRRRAASAIDMSGSPVDDEAAVAAAGLRLAARQRHVDVADLVDLKALADGLDAAERLEQRAQPIAGQAEDLEVDVASTRAGRAADRAPSRRRSARGRRRRGRRRRSARASASVIARSRVMSASASVTAGHVRTGLRPKRLHDAIAEAGRERVEPARARATCECG